jgi:hypothetical protein
MAEQSGHELLSHEIGHSFGLGHVDGDSRYDQTNVMHSASNVRQFLTEGQVFRSHYNSFSALRSLYAARTDAARNCADSSGSTTCPALERRLWPDGSFPSDEPLLQMDLQVARWLLADCDVGETPVADALLEASHEAAESALLDVLDSADWAGNESVRTRAIQGLGLVGDDRAVTRLRHLADSTSGYANAAKAAIAAIDARQRWCILDP